jgi:hypothetical protein
VHGAGGIRAQPDVDGGKLGVGPGDQLQGLALDFSGLPGLFFINIAQVNAGLGQVETDFQRLKAGHLSDEPGFFLVIPGQVFQLQSIIYTLEAIFQGQRLQINRIGNEVAEGQFWRHLFFNFR